MEGYLLSLIWKGFLTNSFVYHCKTLIFVSLRNRLLGGGFPENVKQIHIILLLAQKLKYVLHFESFPFDFKSGKA